MERSNSVRMNGITGREQVYTAYDGGSIVEPQQRDKMLTNFMAPKRLVLKEGAQVCVSRRCRVRITHSPPPVRRSCSSRTSTTPCSPTRSNILICTYGNIFLESIHCSLYHGVGGIHISLGYPLSRWIRRCKLR